MTSDLLGSQPVVIKSAHYGSAFWLVHIVLDSVILFSFVVQLSVRRKNAKEMFGGFFKNMVKSADEVLISGVKVSVPINSLWVCFYWYQHKAAVFCLMSWYVSFFLLSFCRRLMSFLNRRRLFCWIIPLKSKIPLPRLRKWRVHTKVRPFHPNESTGCKYFGSLLILRDILIHKKIVFLF